MRGPSFNRKLWKLLMCIDAGVLTAANGYSADTPLDEWLKVNGKLQGTYLSIQTEGAENPRDGFVIPRARLKLTGSTGDKLQWAIQSQYASSLKGSNTSLKIIDAYATYPLDAQYQLLAGQHMAPALRQNLTQAGALLAIDRPSLTFKSITWGIRSRYGFNSQTVTQTDPGIHGNTGTRDTGLTLFGRIHHDELHFKHYLGLYNGAENAENLRLTGRVQINWADAEDGYFNSAYYETGKNTVGLGLSIDHQDKIGFDPSSMESISYRLASLDFFMQNELESGYWNIEAAIINLDLQDALSIANNATRMVLGPVSPRAAQGSGFYLQAAFTYAAWQFWFLNEDWKSDDDEKIGSFSNVRLGVSIRINPYLEAKFGVEKWESQSEIPSVKPKFRTALAGLYYNF